MDKLPTHVFLCSFFLAFLLLSCPATSSHEPEAQSDDDFNYDPNSENGPDHWGDIRPDWYMCKNGTMQSPINLDHASLQLTSLLGTLQLNYHPSNATLMSTGHDIKLEWAEGAGYVLINATEYVLQQCHWHSPSEHTINGTRFDLEIHFVHESEAGQIAVIAEFYKIESPDPFLQSIADDLEYIAEHRDEKVELGVVDPEQVIKINRTEYYRYMGSLTTPPCHENVVWTVVREVQPVSFQQVRLLRVAVRDESYTNARPLQPLNGRLVQLQVPEYPPDN